MELRATHVERARKRRRRGTPAFVRAHLDALGVDASTDASTANGGDAARDAPPGFLAPPLMYLDPRGGTQPPHRPLYATRRVTRGSRGFGGKSSAGVGAGAGVGVGAGAGAGRGGPEPERGRGGLEQEPEPETSDPETSEPGPAPGWTRRCA